MANETVRRIRVVDPGYRSPDEQPEDFICTRVFIPNDILHIAAFWGSLQVLTQWLAWERGGTKAKEAADVWKVAFELSRSWWEDNLGSCGVDMDVRQNEESPCTLEKSSDGIEWETFANLALCAPRLRIIDGVIQQETETGVWETVSPVTQPVEDRLNGQVIPVWSTVPVGETGNCLAANNASAYVNMVVYEIGNAFGAATEFAAILAIVLGFLGGTVTGVIGLISLALLELAAWEISNWNDIRDYDTTDDLTDIFNCLFDSTGVMSQGSWNTALARIDNIRAGCGTDECLRRWYLVKLIVNILGPVGLSRLAGSSGISTAECDVCPFDWQHIFDFESSDCGFEAVSYAGTVAGIYVPGVGWRGVWTDGDAWRYILFSPVIASTEITAASLEWDYDDTERDYGNWAAGVFIDGSPVGYQIVQGGVYSPPPIFEGTVYGEADYTGTRYRINGGNTKLPRGSHSNGDIGGVTVKRLVLWGNGSDPF